MPFGSLTWTTPLLRKNSDTGGSVAVMIALIGLIAADGAQRGEFGQFLRAQSCEQRLFGELGHFDGVISPL